MNWIAAFDWPQTLALAATSCLVVSALAVWISSQLRNQQLHLKHQILFSALLACGMAACMSLSIATLRWTPFSVSIASSQSRAAVTSPHTPLQKDALDASEPSPQPSIQPSATRQTPMATRAEPTRSRASAFPLVNPQTSKQDIIRSRGWTLTNLLIATWITGSVLLLLRFCRTHVRCMSLIRRSSRPDDKKVLQLAREVSHLIGLRRRPSIRLSNQLAGPAIVGLIHPTLLIPLRLIEKLDHRALRHVLLHELAHVKRKDNTVVYLAALIKVLFWPIPTVYWLCSSLEQAREELCDEFVLRSGQAVEYVEALIQVAKLAQMPQDTPSLAVGMVARKGAFEQRVERILAVNNRNESRLGRLAGFAVLTIAIATASSISTLRFTLAETPVQEGFSEVGPKANALPPKADEKHPTKEISVSGVIRNAKGEPVAGAKVYLATTNWRDRLVAETVANSEGEYSFKDATVELYKPASNSVSIMVFATANGMPIGWEGMKRVYFDNPNLNFPPHMKKRMFFPGEEIRIDIEFGRSSAMYGQVKDMDGKPLEDAKITIRKLDYLDTAARDAHVNFREFYCQGLMPKEIRETTTTEDGTFVLKSLPAGTYAMLQVEHEKHATRVIYVANMPGRRREFDRPEGSSTSIENGQQVMRVRTVATEMQTHPILLQLKPTQPVQVRVVDEKGKALQGMSVRLYSKDRKNREDTFGGKSDSTGIVDFRAAAGEYSLVVRPPRKTDRVETQVDWTVEKDKPNKTQVELKLGGIVVFKAVDGSTGAPIAGVGFGVRKANQISGLTSVPHYVDHPKTDKNGELRVLMKPGTHGIDAGFHVQPDGYRADKHQRAVKVESGKVHSVKFEFRR